jgi:membrane-bound lytic murein transglycosylase D
MTIKNITFSFLMIAGCNAFAQDTITTSELTTSVSKITFLDSIKATFQKDAMASCVDSLWMKELTSTDIYDSMYADIKNFNPDEKVDYELSTELLKARLKELDARSPFNIEYNPGLENLIKSFLKNRKKSFERLMAVSEYYFPLFEEALAKQNVPLEIKYLAVVESALNPKAVSKMGATGLWQFMYQTGKQYNLHIDSYVDERSDVLKASEAAAKYMSNMYRIFGDWDLVLASYNSGPGNVAKAIRRSGGQENYWNIRKNLPKETQGYVPAFLATMYIYEFHKEHGIVPNRAQIKHFATDTVAIRQQISFKQISDLLDIPVAQLQLLNPSYKLNIVPNYKDKLHFLRLPADKVGMFTNNEEKIYAYVNYELSKREKPFFSTKSDKDSTMLASNDNTTTRTRNRFHVVKRGESFGSLSNKYGVSVSDIKRWNGLKSNVLPAGKKLKIVTYETTTIAQAKVKEPKPAVTEVAVAEEQSNEAAEQQFYTVQPGDNLNAIARKFNVSVADLKTWNNMEDNTVRLDTRLKVKSYTNEESQDIAKSSIQHTVEKGDNLAALSRRYGVTVAQIQEWNKLADSNIQLGSKLLIITNDDSSAKKAVAASSAVKQSKAPQESHYLVRKGDSLFTIAKKYPGVTVSDIKKWNGISGNDLRPGMKLKING